MDDTGRRLREQRLAAGWTQGELADRARVSRALVGALERGRHVPATDAAIRLARALGTTVERLFDPTAAAADLVAVSVLGGGLPECAQVRAAWVQEATVARVVDPVSALTSTGAPADGVVLGGRVRLFAGAVAQGTVIAGCDPVLGVAEGLLERTGGSRIVGVPATSGQALEALQARRCHGVLVHGPAGSLRPPAGLRRWHVTRWRSGLATHPDLRRPGLDELLSGELELVHRDRSAACQQALERARRRIGAPRRKPPRIAGGHLEAARAALESRGGAVAIEPVAVAMGLDFTELEVHDVELWVPDPWVELPGIQALLDLMGTARFRDRAGALPAYDFTDTGAAR